MEQPLPSSPSLVGRYALYGEIASGGMATVHYGRLLGPVGFSRTVAIKRLHAHLAKDPEFVSMFVDEALVAARIRHPNVVPTLDVVASDGEVLLVMDYVQGESLAHCLRASVAARRPIPLEVISAVVCSVLHGLEAAHDAHDEQGAPLGIVHRDVSPQNILIGADGVTRVLDFGVAKARGRMQSTREGQLKGKLAYMSPEQLRGQGTVDRRTDVYAAGVVLWETLTRQRLFSGDNEGILIRNVLERRVEPPSSIVPAIPHELDRVALRALDRDPDLRFATAKEMALALEDVVPLASGARVSEWLESLVGPRLAERAATVAQIESSSGRLSTGGGLDAALAVGSGVRSAASSPDVASSSQVSNVTAATSSVRTLPAPNRRWIWVAAGAGAAIVLALVGRIGFGVASRPSSASLDEPTVFTVAPPPQATADPPPLAPLPPQEAVPLPAASASDSPAPATPSTGSHTSRPRPPAGGGAATKPCTIKSYLDESGIKHFVKECK